jgi:chromosome segregation ATPase
MTKRLTVEREQEIRKTAFYDGPSVLADAIDELLAEIEALRADYRNSMQDTQDVLKERDQCLEDYKTLNARSIDLELEVLRAELDDARSTRLAIQVEQLKEENQKLREALEFYADDKQYWLQPSVSRVDIDRGKRARTALGLVNADKEALERK